MDEDSFLHSNNKSQTLDVVMSGEDESTRFVVINDPKNPAPFNTCNCGHKPIMSGEDAPQQHDINSRSIFCQAIDCFDGKMIGCCNQAKLALLFRSSKR